MLKFSSLIPYDYSIIMNKIILIANTNMHNDKILLSL